MSAAASSMSAGIGAQISLRRAQRGMTSAELARRAGISKGTRGSHPPLRARDSWGDETAATAMGVLRRAVSWFAARGVTVERVLSDNGPAYKSHLWRDTCRELEIKAKKTRPYRPQTNGKIERFHRTLADGWAFKRFYATESARRNALPAWLHHYNHHRPHTAIGGHPPISRLTNLPGQYS